MFGATCYGIVTDDPHEAIRRANVPGSKQDSMGRDAIVYWPDVEGKAR
jgi:hypothetical protein